MPYYVYVSVSSHDRVNVFSSDPAPGALDTHAIVAARSRPTALSADIGAADTTNPVGRTAGYAPHGSTTIESETIYDAGTTTTSFTGARRGAAGTTAASHSASSADIVMDWTIAETVDWVMGAVVLTAAGSPSPGIAFDAAGSVVQNATAASFTWSHTVSGSNRILVVGVSMRNTW